jgi:hypothetical protein
MYILVYIKKFMSMTPNPKELNIILNILKGAQFKFLPRAPFYIDTLLYPTQKSLKQIMFYTAFMAASQEGLSSVSKYSVIIT